MLPRRYLWCALLYAAAACGADQPLLLHYHARPPLYYSKDGMMQGLLAGPLEQALHQAGLAHRWQETPFNRTLALIRAKRGPDCGVGWLYTAERAQFGQYSVPMFRSRAMVALVNPKVELKSGGPVEALLDHADYILVVRENFSYGRELDQRILAHRPKRLFSTGALPQLVRMVAAGHADYMFVDREEAATLRMPGVKELGFSNLRGEPHYLFCSQAVSARQMAQLNRALAALPAVDR